MEVQTSPFALNRQEYTPREAAAFVTKRYDVLKQRPYTYAQLCTALLHNVLSDISDAQRAVYRALVFQNAITRTTASSNDPEEVREALFRSAGFTLPSLVYSTFESSGLAESIVRQRAVALLNVSAESTYKRVLIVYNAGLGEVGVAAATLYHYDHVVMIAQAGQNLRELQQHYEQLITNVTTNLKLFQDRSERARVPDVGVSVIEDVDNVREGLLKRSRRSSVRRVVDDISGRDRQTLLRVVLDVWTNTFGGFDNQVAFQPEKRVQSACDRASTYLHMIRDELQRRNRMYVAIGAFLVQGPDYQTLSRDGQRTLLDSLVFSDSESTLAEPDPFIRETELVSAVDNINRRVPDLFITDLNEHIVSASRPDAAEREDVTDARAVRMVREVVKKITRRDEPFFLRSGIVSFDVVATNVVNGPFHESNNAHINTVYNVGLASNQPVHKAHGGVMLFPGVQGDVLNQDARVVDQMRDERFYSVAVYENVAAVFLSGTEDDRVDRLSRTLAVDLRAQTLYTLMSYTLAVFATASEEFTMDVEGASSIMRQIHEFDDQNLGPGEWSIAYMAAIAHARMFGALFTSPLTRSLRSGLYWRASFQQALRMFSATDIEQLRSGIPRANVDVQFESPVLGTTAFLSLMDAAFTKEQTRHVVVVDDGASVLMEHLIRGGLLTPGATESANANASALVTRPAAYQYVVDSDNGLLRLEHAMRSLQWFLSLGKQMNLGDLFAAPPTMPAELPSLLALNRFKMRPQTYDDFRRFWLALIVREESEAWRVYPSATDEEKLRMLFSEGETILTTQERKSMFLWAVPYEPGVVFVNNFSWTLEQCVAALRALNGIFLEGYNSARTTNASAEHLDRIAASMQDTRVLFQCDLSLFVSDTNAIMTNSFAGDQSLIKYFHARHGLVGVQRVQKLGIVDTMRQFLLNANFDEVLDTRSSTLQRIVYASESLHSMFQQRATVAGSYRVFMAPEARRDVLRGMTPIGAKRGRRAPETILITDSDDDVAAPSTPEPIVISATPPSSEERAKRLRTRSPDSVIVISSPESVAKEEPQRIDVSRVKMEPVSPQTVAMSTPIATEDSPPVLPKPVIVASGPTETPSSDSSPGRMSIERMSDVSMEYDSSSTDESSTPTPSRSPFQYTLDATPTPPRPAHSTPIASNTAVATNQNDTYSPDVVATMDETLDDDPWFINRFNATAQKFVSFQKRLVGEFDPRAGDHELRMFNGTITLDQFVVNAIGLLPPAYKMPENAYGDRARKRYPWLLKRQWRFGSAFEEFEQDAYFPSQLRKVPVAIYGDAMFDDAQRRAINADTRIETEVSVHDDNGDHLYMYPAGLAEELEELLSTPDADIEIELNEDAAQSSRVHPGKWPVVAMVEALLKQFYMNTFAKVPSKRRVVSVLTGLRSPLFREALSDAETYTYTVPYGAEEAADAAEEIPATPPALEMLTPASSFAVSDVSAEESEGPVSPPLPGVESEDLSSTDVMESDIDVSPAMTQRASSSEADIAVLLSGEKRRPDFTNASTSRERARRLLTEQESLSSESEASEAETRATEALLDRVQTTLAQDPQTSFDRAADALEKYEHLDHADTDTLTAIVDSPPSMALVSRAMNDAMDLEPLPSNPNSVEFQAREAQRRAAETTVQAEIVRFGTPSPTQSASMDVEIFTDEEYEEMQGQQPDYAPKVISISSPESTLPSTPESDTGAITQAPAQTTRPVLDVVQEQFQTETRAQLEEPTTPEARVIQPRTRKGVITPTRNQRLSTMMMDRMAMVEKIDPQSVLREGEKLTPIKKVTLPLFNKMVELRALFNETQSFAFIRRETLDSVEPLQSGKRLAAHIVSLNEALKRYHKRREKQIRQQSSGILEQVRVLAEQTAALDKVTAKSRAKKGPLGEFVKAAKFYKSKVAWLGETGHLNKARLAVQKELEKRLKKARKEYDDALAGLKDYTDTWFDAKIGKLKRDLDILLSEQGRETAEATLARGEIERYERMQEEMDFAERSKLAEAQRRLKAAFLHQIEADAAYAIANLDTIWSAFNKLSLEAEQAALSTYKALLRNLGQWVDSESGSEAEAFFLKDAKGYDMEQTRELVLMLETLVAQVEPLLDERLTSDTMERVARYAQARNALIERFRAASDQIDAENVAQIELGIAAGEQTEDARTRYESVKEAWKTACKAVVITQQEVPEQFESQLIKFIQHQRAVQRGEASDDDYDLDDDRDEYYSPSPSRTNVFTRSPTAPLFPLLNAPNGVRMRKPEDVVEMQQYMDRTVQRSVIQRDQRELYQTGEVLQWLEQERTNVNRYMDQMYTQYADTASMVAASVRSVEQEDNQILENIASSLLDSPITPVEVSKRCEELIEFRTHYLRYDPMSNDPSKRVRVTFELEEDGYPQAWANTGEEGRKRAMFNAWYSCTQPDTLHDIEAPTPGVSHMDRIAIYAIEHRMNALVDYESFLHGLKMKDIALIVAESSVDDVQDAVRRKERAALWTYVFDYWLLGQAAAEMLVEELISKEDMPVFERVQSRLEKRTVHTPEPLRALQDKAFEDLIKETRDERELLGDEDVIEKSAVDVILGALAEESSEQKLLRALTDYLAEQSISTAEGEPDTEESMSRLFAFLNDFYKTQFYKRKSKRREQRKAQLSPSTQYPDLALLDKKALMGLANTYANAVFIQESYGYLRRVHEAAQTTLNKLLLLTARAYYKPLRTSYEKSTPRTQRVLEAILTPEARAARMVTLRVMEQIDVRDSNNMRDIAQSLVGHVLYGSEMMADADANLKMTKDRALLYATRGTGLMALFMVRAVLSSLDQAVVGFATVEEMHRYSPTEPSISLQNMALRMLKGIDRDQKIYDVVEKLLDYIEAIAFEPTSAQILDYMDRLIVVTQITLVDSLVHMLSLRRFLSVNMKEELALQTRKSVGEWIQATLKPTAVIFAHQFLDRVFFPSFYAAQAWLTPHTRNVLETEIHPEFLLINSDLLRFETGQKPTLAKRQPQTQEDVDAVDEGLTRIAQVYEDAVKCLDRMMPTVETLPLRDGMQFEEDMKRAIRALDDALDNDTTRSDGSKWLSKALERGREDLAAVKSFTAMETFSNIDSTLDKWNQLARKTRARLEKEPPLIAALTQSSSFLYEGREHVKVITSQRVAEETGRDVQYESEFFTEAEDTGDIEESAIAGEAGDREQEKQIEREDTRRGKRDNRQQLDEFRRVVRSENIAAVHQPLSFEHELDAMSPRFANEGLETVRCMALQGDPDLPYSNIMLLPVVNANGTVNVNETQVRALQILQSDQRVESIGMMAECINMLSEQGRRKLTLQPGQSAVLNATYETLDLSSLWMTYVFPEQQQGDEIVSNMRVLSGIAHVMREYGSIQLGVCSKTLVLLQSLENTVQEWTRSRAAVQFLREIEATRTAYESRDNTRYPVLMANFSALGERGEDVTDASGLVYRDASRIFFKDGALTAPRDGLFANVPIAEDTLITQYYGRVITPEDESWRQQLIQYNKSVQDGDYDVLYISEANTEPFLILPALRVDIHQPAGSIANILTNRDRTKRYGINTALLDDLERSEERRVPNVEYHVIDASKHVVVLKAIRNIAQGEELVVRPPLDIVGGERLQQQTRRPVSIRRAEQPSTPLQAQKRRIQPTVVRPM